MKKYFYAVTLTFFLFISLTGNAQTFQWARDIKSEGFDEGFDLVADPLGNVYVCGQIEFLCNFGFNVILESAGRHDIFVCKYDSTGQLIWAKRAGGKGGDKAQSIALDGNGFLYLAGEYEDTSYWETIMKTTPEIGVNNEFIAKYDTSGNVIWVRNISTTGVLHTRGYGVTCDAHGNVYACGGTKGDTYYDNNFLFSSAGDYDGTVVSFDPNGNFRWAHRMGGADSDKAYGIVSDKHNAIYVTGYFAGYADFSPSASLGGLGHTDIFLAKYDTLGLLQWVRQAGDTGFDRGWDVTVNTNGQIIITGESQAHAQFGAYSVSGFGNEDMFLAAYNANGVAQWALSSGGVEDDIGRGVEHDAAGNIYVAGDYGGSAVFPPDTVVGNGYAETFLAGYDANGQNLLWLKSAGGHDNDRGRGVGADPFGNIFFCGEYVDSAWFGNTDLIGDTNLDIFVTRLVPGFTCSSQVGISGYISCPGACDGSLFANAAGTGPFTYTWSTSPVQHGSSASGLCAGNYTVTTTDHNGCGSTASFSLVDPAPVQVTITGTDPTCHSACDGTALASATGPGTFTYAWSTAPVTSGQQASNLCAGTYTVTATNSTGCSATHSVSITAPGPVGINALSVNPVCFGSCDGSASALASGPGTFSYSWSTSPVTTGQQAINLCDGSYTVTATNNAGCSVTTSVTITSPAQVQVTATPADASCYGVCDGTASATATGPGTFTYSWSTSPATSGQQATGLCSGNYMVTATNNNGCTATTSVSISSPGQIQVSATPSDASCHGTCDGSASASATGAASFTYSWSTSPVQSGQAASSLCAGNYIVTATGNNGCTATSSVAISEPGPLQISGTVAGTTCIGCSNGAVVAQASGGTATYQYHWSTGATTAFIQNVPAGTYRVCVTDAHVCLYCDSFVVLDNPTGIKTISASSRISVFPNPVHGIATIQIMNGGFAEHSVVLFDVIGKTIRTAEFTGDEFRLDVLDLQSGVYFLQLKNEETHGWQVVPIMVEK